MKRFFLLFAFFFLAFLLVAQEKEYTISETELLRLEKILETLSVNKHNQQLQVQSLKMRLNEALMKSVSLKEQLQTERETLEKLRRSYAEYEREVSVKIEMYETLIDKLKNSLHRTKLALVIISCLFIVWIVSSIVFFILKRKLKYF